ncbi:MAG: TIGR00282 family metallophosphoesterase [Calditrichia bacterium]
MSKSFSVVFISDIVGEDAVDFLIEKLPIIKQTYQPEFLIANAENAHNGKGVSVGIASKLKRAGFDCLTSGNHIWDIRQRDILNDEKWNNFVLRPANYPQSLPGKGYIKLRKENLELMVVNVQGTVYMESIDSPFRFFDDHIMKFRVDTKNILVDFHAEATSEKKAIFHHLNGRVSAVLGTHTHVQTADEFVSDEGTGFISDAGMTGPMNSVIGMDTESALRRFREKIPVHYKLAKGLIQIEGVALHIDPQTGKCTHLERIQIK